MMQAFDLSTALQYNCKPVIKQRSAPQTCFGKKWPSIFGGCSVKKLRRLPRKSWNEQRGKFKAVKKGC